MSVLGKFKIMQSGFHPEFTISEGALSSFSRFFSKDKEYVVFPGFCDVHVHFREPGFSYKETIRTGSLSAARGGYTAVCTMPNLNPAPDSVEHIDIQLDLIKNSVINVYPYGTITKNEAGNELSDMDGVESAVLVSYNGDYMG